MRRFSCRCSAAGDEIRVAVAGELRGPDEVDWYFRLVGLDRELQLVDRPPVVASGDGPWTAGADRHEQRLSRLA